MSTVVVAGKIAGIQQFVFATNEAGGGQSKRLRARSLVVSLIAEVAALRVLHALCWPLDNAHYVLHGAGKFLLQGRPETGYQAVLDAECRTMCTWLERHLNGELQLVVAAGESEDSAVPAYRDAQQRLHRMAARPWAPDPGEPWDSSRLILEPLAAPCSLCGRFKATEDEQDPDTGLRRRICTWCMSTWQLGHQLPRAQWLVVRRPATAGDLDLMGYGVTILHAPQPAIPSGAVALGNLLRPEHRPDWCPADLFLERRLISHVPVDGDGRRPLEFTEIAARAAGGRLLGVLVADVDNLGTAVDATLAGSPEFSKMADLSRALEEFFAGFLKSMLERPGSRWQTVYTLFAGGDDLVMVGPWDIMFAFAGQLRDWFAERFGSQGLTLSAGLALSKPKRPVRAGVADAKRLVDVAKTQAAQQEVAPKDQCAALGQLWKWKAHQEIQEAAIRLVRWVEAGEVQRTWLLTLFHLLRARHPHLALAGTQPSRCPDPLATARLAHHVSRNYRRASPSRQWAENLIAEFDDPAGPTVRYLPSVLRYALTATRTPTEDE